MFKLFTVCLILSLGFLEPQVYGRYTIESIDSRTSEGFVTINQYNITLSHDSTVIILPVVDQFEDNSRTFFVLEGCYHNVSFKGLATLYAPDRRKDTYYCILYVEIRTKEAYSFTRYYLYYHV